MLYMKHHKTDKGSIIALCDKEHLGRVFKDKKSGILLDLDKYADFYKGELLDYAAAKKAFNADELYSANIIGEESVKLVLEAGIAVTDEVREIEGVPYVQIYRMI